MFMKLITFIFMYHVTIELCKNVGLINGGKTKQLFFMQKLFIKYNINFFNIFNIQNNVRFIINT